MRVSSQLTFCSPLEILRRTVVEQDEQKLVTRLFSLDECNVESAQTLFFDGIISAEIISLKENNAEVNEVMANYQYVDVSQTIPTQIIAVDKPLLLDFGTHSTEKINQLLKQLAPALSAFSIFEIIAACTYYPGLALGKVGALASGRNTQLILWEGVDLVNKQIKESTRIREII